MATRYDAVVLGPAMAGPAVPRLPGIRVTASFLERGEEMLPGQLRPAHGLKVKMPLQLAERLDA